MLQQLLPLLVLLPPLLLVLLPLLLPLLPPLQLVPQQCRAVLWSAQHVHAVEESEVGQVVGGVAQRQVVGRCHPGPP